jgi:hypothetical protein
MIAPSWTPVRGLDPSPDQAREWLAQELNRSSYRGSWLESLLRWVLRQLNNLLDGVSRVGGLSPVITVLVALVVITLLGWVLPKVRRESAAAGAEWAVLRELTTSAATYRDRAARAFTNGRYDEAVLDWFRALARDMSDRTLLDDAPGRTAHEVSLALGHPFPGQAERIGHAADVFDSVRYGHRGVTAEQADAVQKLDAELVRTRPKLAASPRQDAAV